ncbi:hypothetical protein [Alsobacter sp. SYSU BS001988]
MSPKFKFEIRMGEEFNGDWMPWAAQGKRCETDRDRMVKHRRS